MSVLFSLPPPFFHPLMGACDITCLVRMVRMAPGEERLYPPPSLEGRGHIVQIMQGSGASSTFFFFILNFTLGSVIFTTISVYFSLTTFFFFFLNGFWGLLSAFGALRDGLATQSFQVTFVACLGYETCTTSIYGLEGF